MNILDSASTCFITEDFILTPCSSRRNSFIQQKPEETMSNNKQRIRINVRGMKFETFKDTLEKFPDTLLGSPDKREQFYDKENQEYYFDRDKTAFDCILFFYQSNGIISKPDDISNKLFEEELMFYELVKNEIEAIPETFVNVPETSFRSKVWKILEFPGSSTFAKCLANLSVIMIVLSTIIFCIETLPSFEAKFEDIQVRHNNQSILLKDTQLCQTSSVKDYEDKNHFNTVSTGITSNCTKLNKSSNTRETRQNSTNHDFDVWFVLESIFISFFTCEYVARLYASPRRVHFVKSTLGIVDFIAIFPFYLTLILQHDYYNVTSFSVIRVTRIVRVMRVLKLSRYHKGLAILGRTISASSGQMKALFLCVFLTTVLFASVIYYVESYQKNSPFESIPATFWYVVITMTTVGYGDVTPRSPLGKLTGAACAFVGLILLLCLPTPVFVSNFVKFYLEECHSDDTRLMNETDPHSGKPQWADQDFKNMKYVTVKNSKSKDK